MSGSKGKLHDDLPSTLPEGTDERHARALQECIAFLDCADIFRFPNDYRAKGGKDIVDLENFPIIVLSTVMSSNIHKNPPFKAEHLGSLLRPEHLLEARKAAENHSANTGALKAAEDRAIEDIVHAQLDIGFNSISDGEYRRHSKNLTDQ